ncbi:MAG: transglutaminase-like domain-containing protein [Pirellulales bacterium]|nr:transglutaminase-like domain-containing protein [Pirellulales bacterium]
MTATFLLRAVLALIEMEQVAEMVAWRKIVIVVLGGWVVLSGFAFTFTHADQVNSAQSTTIGRQDNEDRQSFDPGAGPKRGEKRTVRYRIGVVLKGTNGACRGVVTSMPVPQAWPEQEVKIIDEEKSPLVRKTSFRTLNGTVRQYVVEVPNLPAGAEAKAIVTFEVTKYALDSPEDESVFRLPRKVTRELRGYLRASPHIEITDRQIKAKAIEVGGTAETAWGKAEAIYDWVQENIEYVNGPIKGAKQAMIDGTGDCEELSSLFIAMCRINKIPARMVWIPTHCYPEFYLEDESGQGYWIPCQSAGDHSFGRMYEFKPILQKGDNFRVPGFRGAQRYVSENLKSQNGAPGYEFVREQVE